MVGAGGGLADSQSELEDDSMGLRWPCTTPGAIGLFLFFLLLMFLFSSEWMTSCAPRPW